MKYVRLFAILLLVYLSLGAIAGSVPMIFDPIGRQWALLPLSLLIHSPFHSFLIPGIILLTANGLLALCVLWLVLMRKPRYGLWTMLQGCVLLGWLGVQCLMLRQVVWLHYLYGLVALALVLSGLALHREPASPLPPQG